MFIFLALHSVQSLCMNTTNVKHQTSTQVKSNTLPFCMEHNTRTCCDPSSSLTIYKKFYKTFNDPPIYPNYDGYSTACMQYSQRVLCSECDGDIGEGLLSGICTSLCDKWFSSCTNDYFMSNSKEIEFCTGNSLICFKLSEIVQSGTEFCKHFGLLPQNTDCFDGTPSSQTKGPAQSPAQPEFPSFLPYLILIFPLSLISFYYLKQKVSKHNFDIREARLKRFHS